MFWGQQTLLITTHRSSIGRVAALFFIDAILLEVLENFHPFRITAVIADKSVSAEHQPF